VLAFDLQDKEIYGSKHPIPLADFSIVKGAYNRSENFKKISGQKIIPILLQQKRSLIFVLSKKNSQ
jgi:hypothetical protein